MTGVSMEAKDDHEAIQKASSVYDALYTHCKLKIIRSVYETELQKMNRKVQREFLRNN